MSPTYDFRGKVALVMGASAGIGFAAARALTIPGTRNPIHLAENLTARFVKLTPAELAEMDARFSKLNVRGGRMNAMQMKVVE